MNVLKKQFSALIILFLISCLCICNMSIINVYAVDASDVKFYNGHRYQVFNDCIKWSEAKESCEKRGGHLVTITSKSEQKFVYSILKNEKKNTYWIGLYESGSTQKWVTDEKFSYSNIEEEHIGQYYYGMYGGSAKSFNKKGEWYDHDDTIRNDYWDYTKTGYICEWDTTPLRYTDISLSKNVYYYNEKTQKPSVKIVLDGKVLKKGKHYTVKYSNNKKVGTAKVTIKGKGNYKGTIVKTFKISRPSIKLKETIVTIKKGNTYKLVAMVKGNSKKVKWSSSDTKVAVINSKGIVTAKKRGTTYITATANNKSVICQITVK